MPALGVRLKIYSPLIEPTSSKRSVFTRWTVLAAWSHLRHCGIQTRKVLSSTHDWQSNCTTVSANYSALLSEMAYQLAGCRSQVRSNMRIRHIKDIGNQFGTTTRVGVSRLLSCKSSFSMEAGVPSRGNHCQPPSSQDLIIHARWTVRGIGSEPFRRATSLL